MHYVYIENATVTSILNYEANVPDTIQVFPISDEDYALIMDRSSKKFFNVETLKVEDIKGDALSAIEQEEINAASQSFLDMSDWKVLRHLREKALGVETSLTEEEYILLEQQRAEAAAKIVK